MPANFGNGRNGRSGFYGFLSGRCSLFWHFRQAFWTAPRSVAPDYPQNIASGQNNSAGAELPHDPNFSGRQAEVVGNQIRTTGKSFDLDNK